MDRDKSIIIQVAAKIAAELTDKSANTEAKTSEFTVLFMDVKDVLLESVYGGQTAAASTIDINAQDEATLKAAFPEAKETHDIKVVGKQHGDLPDWLITACKRDGITKVYDNRDGLAANPKRPWFKAVDDKEKAYWPPRGK